MHRILSKIRSHTLLSWLLPVAAVVVAVLIVTGRGEEDSEISYRDRPPSALDDGQPGAGVAEGTGASAEDLLVSLAPTSLRERKVSFALSGITPDTVRNARVRSKRAILPVSLTRVKTAARNGKLIVKVPRKFGRLTRKKVALEITTELPATVAEPSSTESGGGEASAPVPPPATQVPAAPMLISPEQLAALPSSGAAYDFMKSKADAAVAYMDLDSTPSAMSPWLSNYNGSGAVTRPGVQTLAAALVYARTGDAAYRNFVILANRYVIGSEDSASTDGTLAADRTLATARNIGAYVLAADLVGMDGAETGSRAGYTTTTWQSWLSSLRTKTIGAPANCNSLVACSDQRGHNWGAFATGARISIDIYLGDGTDLAAAVSRLKRFLGESSEGAQWLPSRDFDLSFACIPADGQWRAVNPASCGPEKDGMIVEDISRSAISFPGYDSTGIGYTMESYQGLLLSAILLERQGYDPFNWGDQALRRVMDWLVREGKPQGNNSSVERHQSWVAQHFYGKSYPTVPANMGRTFGFTDWLYAS